MSVASFGSAFMPFAQKLAEVMPAETVVVLGADEDGRLQGLSALLEQLDTVGAEARACVFAL